MRRSNLIHPSERKYREWRGSPVLGEPSEPELRKDEQVCEVTGYVYLRGLQRSPYIDASGKPV